MARIVKIIFRFAMLVGEEVFLAEVQEKKKALETYNEAVDNGQSAGESNFDDFCKYFESRASFLNAKDHQGHVALTGRDSNQFSVSANAEAGGRVKFHLIYEELLQRRSGELQ